MLSRSRESLSSSSYNYTTSENSYTGGGGGGGSMKAQTMVRRREREAIPHHHHHPHTHTYSRRHHHNNSFHQVWSLLHRYFSCFLFQSKVVPPSEVTPDLYPCFSESKGQLGPLEKKCKKNCIFVTRPLMFIRVVATTVSRDVRPVWLLPQVPPPVPPWSPGTARQRGFKSSSTGTGHQGDHIRRR